MWPNVLQNLLWRLSLLMLTFTANLFSLEQLTCSRCARNLNEAVWATVISRLCTQPHNVCVWVTITIKTLTLDYGEHQMTSRMAM